MSFKKQFLFSIIIICLFSSLDSVGQGLAEKYFNIKFSYNPNTVKTNEGEYNIIYKNDKGTHPSIYNLLSSYNTNQYNIGLGFGKFKGLNHTIYFELLTGKIKKGQFGYSIGYNFAIEGNKNDFLIRPSLGLMFGNTSIIFEEIYSTDRIIPLYGEKYEAKSAEIQQTHTNYLSRPSVTFTYLFKQILGISVEMGYNIDLSKKTGKYEVYFTEYSDADPKLVNNIIDDKYSVINSTGQLSKDKIYNLSGFYWSIGLSAYKSFDYD